jgi:hypothetical protein
LAAKEVTAEEVGFPFARQMARIDRERTILSSNKLSRESVYVITSLEPAQADAARLLELVRGHWTIENNLHHCRDRTFDEDRCQIRHPNGAQVMASLRNLVISLDHLAQANRPRQRGHLPRALRRFAASTHKAVHLITKKQ